MSLSSSSGTTVPDTSSHMIAKNVTCVCGSTHGQPTDSHMQTHARMVKCIAAQSMFARACAFVFPFSSHVLKTGLTYPSRKAQSLSSEERVPRSTHRYVVQFVAGQSGVQATFRKASKIAPSSRHQDGLNDFLGHIPQHVFSTVKLFWWQRI